MTPERVTITIRSSAGEDAPLTVQDAMHQLLDFFDLLTAAGGEAGRAVSWQLVDISMRSPLSATAEAVSRVPGVPDQTIARAGKAALADAINSLTAGGPVPDWMDETARGQTQRFLQRNTNGIGRMDIDFHNVTPPVIVTARSARSGLAALQRYDADFLAQEVDDHSRTEIGSIEGHVTATTTYYDRLSVWIRDRVTKANVRCIFSDELTERVARQHSWYENWKRGRVLVSGKIHYNTQGKPSRIEATGIRAIISRPLEYNDIADPNFTGGLSPLEYIASLWKEEDVG